MVHLRPARAAALMTSTKPTRWKCVSPATSRSNPQVMTLTTAAKLQLGLQKEIKKK